MKEESSMDLSSIKLSPIELTCIALLEKGLSSPKVILDTDKKSVSCNFLDSTDCYLGYDGKRSKTSQGKCFYFSLINNK